MQRCADLYYANKSERLENMCTEAQRAVEKSYRSPTRKGKLTARERISLLLDPGTFEELSMFDA